jgi:hypothetical protein
MSGRNPSYDGQAEAGAPSVLMGLPVGLKNAREGVIGDTDTRVLDLQFELGTGIDHTDRDTPAAWSKADRVRSEID